MVYQKPADFNRQLRQRTFLPVYLFAGEETYLKEEALQGLEKALDPGALNRETFAVPETPVHEIILAAQTMPFLGERRFLIVKEAQKLKAAEAKKLAGFLENPAPTTCLMLLWAEKLRREDKSSDLFEAVDKAGAVVEFKALYDNELPGWVVQRVHQDGKRISGEAAAYLVQETGTNLLDINNEIEKLSLFIGKKPDITIEDVRTVCGHTRQASLNDIAEAVEGRKTDAALLALERLLEEGEVPLRVQATIYRCVRRLLSAKSMLEEKGLGNQEVKQALRLHPYFDRAFFAHLSRFTLEELKAAIGLILEADLELKTSSRPERMVFEELLLRLTAAGKTAGR